MEKRNKIEGFIDGLSKFDTSVAKGITSKYKALFQGLLLNHTTCKWSDLDLDFRPLGMIIISLAIKHSI